jgi:hypothetical protein
MTPEYIHTKSRPPDLGPKTPRYEAAMGDVVKLRSPISHRHGKRRKEVTLLD